MGQPALAITDHGNLCVAPVLYFEARKAGLEPIIGSEMYWVPNIEATKEAKGKKDETDSNRYHLTVLAKGEAGYHALSELSTESYKNFYYKPLISRETLEAADLDNLVVLSGCANSVLSQIAMMDMEQAVEELRWWKETIPNFYIEIMEHNRAEDKILNKKLFKLARDHKIPMVITQDPHFTVEADCDAHDVLLAIQTGKNVDDPNRMRFDGEGYYLKSAQEMQQAWAGYPAAIVRKGMENTAHIARQCKTRIPSWEKRTWNIPQVPGVENSQEYLDKLVRRALKRKKLHLQPEYVERMEHELSVIKQSKIADFLLITRDSIRWARKQGIPVGPGRGSVCGSLVCYLAGIHKIDSVRYNLLFERFLNPDRPSMPDIDTDFGQERRDEMFTYVSKTYGEENVMHVAAFSHMKTRRAFQALAKVHGLPYLESIAISKTLEDDEEVVLPEKVLTAYPELAAQLEALSGVRAGVIPHPAGVLIAAPEHKIKTRIPQMYLPSSKRWVAQYDLDAVDHLGFMKQDFLGLRTLDTIAIAVELIEQTTGEVLDPDSWVPDEEPGDAEVYAMLSEGDTSGVFQMEGPACTRGIQQISCTKFADISSATSLFRTGPILAGFPEQFVDNRINGAEFDHPILEDILGYTEGVILFQEQVMDIGRKLAGFSWSQVDDLKEAIKHKKSALMESLKDPFLKGCKRQKVPTAVATKVWGQIEGFAGYGFNESHSVAYSVLSYQTARLKCFYPLEFYSALLRTVEDKDKRARYLRALVRRGIKILPPDINHSDARALPERDPVPAIRFGLQDYAGIGPAKVKRILNARPRNGYQQPHQVADLVDVGTYKVLSEGGALSAIGIKGSHSRMASLLGWTFKDKMAPYRDDWERLLIEPGSEEEQVQIIGELVSITNGKTKTGKEYRTWVIRWDPATDWTVRLWQETRAYWHLPIGAFVRIQGVWQPDWGNVNVNGRANPCWVWRTRKWVRAETWTPRKQREPIDA